MKSLFSRLDYPHHLINSTINTLINSRVADQKLLQVSGRLAGNDVTRVTIPFKNQDSANMIVKMQLKDLSIKLQTTIQPVFVSRKIGWPNEMPKNSLILCLLKHPDRTKILIQNRPKTTKILTLYETGDKKTS